MPTGSRDGDVQAEDRLRHRVFRARPRRSSSWRRRSSPSGAPSSAGWKMNLTVPRNCARRPASTSATPIRIAVCVSWPHACMMPTDSPFHGALTFEAKGTSTSSATGSASMSARSATTGPGKAPFSRPTTPVWATPVRTSSRPSFFRCSATMPDGAELAVAELGVGVEVAPPGDDARLDGFRRLVDQAGDRARGDGSVSHVATPGQVRNERRSRRSSENILARRRRVTIGPWKVSSP